MTDSQADSSADETSPSDVPAVRVVRADDPAAVAVELAESSDAELVTPGPMLDDAVTALHEAAGTRSRADAALAAHERLHARPPGALHVLCDTDDLRALAARLRTADTVVAGTDTEVRSRLEAKFSTQEMAVHPSAIRRAADELLEARRALAEAEQLDTGAGTPVGEVAPVDGADEGVAAADAGTGTVADVDRAAGQAGDPVGEPADDVVEGAEADPWGGDPPDLSGADQFGATGDDDARRKLDRDGRFRRGARPAEPEGPEGTADGTSPAVETPEAAPDADEEDERAARRRLVRMIAAVTISVLVALIVTVGGLVNYGLGFILPILTIAWAVGEYREYREDQMDRSVAQDNLVSMSALADQAYRSLDNLRPPDDEPVVGAVGDADDSGDGDPLAGSAVDGDADESGVGGDEDGGGSLLDSAWFGGGGAVAATQTATAPAGSVATRERTIDDARARLERVTSAWHALVGPDADPDDLEAVLRAHDPQYTLGEARLRVTPAVRAAARFRRRLQAEWKVAWAALDRPAPAPDDAEAAIARLEADDIHVVTVTKWQAPPEPGASSALDAEFEELAEGRSIDALAELAAQPLPPLVVADEGGELDDDAIDRLARRLPAGVPVSVVVPDAPMAPPGGGATDEDADAGATD